MLLITVDPSWDVTGSRIKRTQRGDCNDNFVFDFVFGVVLTSKCPFSFQNNVPPLNSCRWTLITTPGRRSSRACRIQPQPASMRSKLKSTASWRETPTHDSSGPKCTEIWSTGHMLNASVDLFDQMRCKRTQVTWVDLYRTPFINP